MRPAARLQEIRSAVSLGPLPAALLAMMVGAGVIDAVCFLGLGQVFTANMTGNIALLGFAIAGVSGLSAAATATSLGVFLLGVLVSSRLAAQLRDRVGAWFTTAIVVEVVLVATAAVVSSRVDPDRLSAASYGAIALLAGAMGIRNAATRRLAVPDLTSTVLTSTLTGLVSESRLAGGTGRILTRRLAAVIALLSGALAGALLVRENLYAPLTLAAALTVGALTIHLVSLARRA